MANKVFANGREIACKSGAGKVIAAFPDVCFTPPDKVPPTPTGVPIPYPLFSQASDADKGTKKVVIDDKEVMKRDSSNFKKCAGDEAAKTAKKGMINGKLTGKVMFTSWSMDVKVEDKNVVRHLDTTTSNHASPSANDPLSWAYLDKGTFATHKDCDTDREREREDCKDYKPNNENGLDVCKEAGLAGRFSRNKSVTTKRMKSASENKCAKARKCRLVPYKGSARDGISGCCRAQTGDHLIPKSSFYKYSFVRAFLLTGWKKYNWKIAPCMCLEGGSCSGSHGLRHSFHKSERTPHVPRYTMVTFDSEVKHCAKSAAKVSGCDPDCIEAQLRAGHASMGSEKKEIKFSPTGKNLTDQMKKIAASLITLGAATR